MDTNQEGHGLSFLESMNQDKIRHDMLEAGTHGHPSLNAHLDVAPEVAAALAVGRPVVALESTIISHGMPYPQNVETALRVEAAIRACGAVPATIAVLGGRLKAGLSASEIEHLGAMGRSVAKASRRDLALLVARKEMAGIKVFATGGIGGVHRGAAETFDISADLEELSRTPVMVICAGAKAILDLRLTLEYLETKGVPVIGYGTSELPAFYTRYAHQRTVRGLSRRFSGGACGCVPYPV